MEEPSNKALTIIKKRNTFNKKYGQMTEKELLYENLFTNQLLLENMEKNKGNTLTLVIGLVLIPFIAGILWWLELS